jgi:hypothetical protein
MANKTAWLARKIGWRSIGGMQQAAEKLVKRRRSSARHQSGAASG